MITKDILQNLIGKAGPHDRILIKFTDETEESFRPEDIHNLRDDGFEVFDTSEGSGGLDQLPETIPYKFNDMMDVALDPGC